MVLFEFKSRFGYEITINPGKQLWINGMLLTPNDMKEILDKYRMPSDKDKQKEVS